MIDIKIDSESRRVLLKLENINELSRRGIRQGFYFLGRKIISDVRKEFLRRPRQGRAYYSKDRAGRRRRHIASEAGETPANWTGKLRNASNFKVNDYHDMDIFYKDKVEYAEWVEFGTAKMAARPGLKIGIDRNEKQADVFFNRELKKALR